MSDEWTKEAFWSQPTFNPTEIGDPNEIGIFTAVGAALSRWETLEDMLATMFQMFWADQKQAVDIRSLTMGRHMFGMFESSSVRLNMLRQAASLYFGHWWAYKQVKEPYNTTFKVIEKLSHRRNEIAHGRVIHATVHREGETTPSGYFLTSPAYNVNRNQPFYGGEWYPDDVLGIDRSKYRYRMKDIAGLTGKFGLLHTKISELIMETSHSAQGIPKIVMRLLEEGKIKPTV